MSSPTPEEDEPSKPLDDSLATFFTPIGPGAYSQPAYPSAPEWSGAHAGVFQHGRLRPTYCAWVLAHHFFDLLLPWVDVRGFVPIPQCHSNLSFHLNWCSVSRPVVVCLLAACSISFSTFHAACGGTVDDRGLTFTRGSGGRWPGRERRQ